jgi:predicted DNA binding CopG/RHH family protein
MVVTKEVKLQVRVQSGQAQALKAQALKRGITLSALLRTLIDQTPTKVQTDHG